MDDFSQFIFQFISSPYLVLLLPSPLFSLFILNVIHELGHCIAYATSKHCLKKFINKKFMPDNSNISNIEQYHNLKFKGKMNYKIVSFISTGLAYAKINHHFARIIAFYTDNEKYQLNLDFPELEEDNKTKLLNHIYKLIKRGAIWGYLSEFIVELILSIMFFYLMYMFYMQNSIELCFIFYIVSIFVPCIGKLIVCVFPLLDAKFKNKNTVAQDIKKYLNPKIILDDFTIIELQNLYFKPANQHFELVYQIEKLKVILVICSISYVFLILSVILYLIL